MTGLAAVMAAAVVSTAPASAAAVTNWVAFNDFGATSPGVGAFTHGANVSGYDLGFGPGGVLINSPGGLFPTAELPAGYPLDGQAKLIVRPVTATGVFGLPASGGQPFPGTPAYNHFAGLVSIGNLGSMFGVGAGQQVMLTFANLNPAMRYKFRGTAVRNGGTVGTHDVRWTLNSITGAVSFVSAHTVSKTLLVPSSPVPGLSLTNGQAAFQSGINTNGMVVGWDDIVPGPDGTFTIVNQPYNGPFLKDDDTVGNATANVGYVLEAFVLTEYGEPIAPAWVTQPVASLTTTQNMNLLLTTKATGTALFYQWYRQGSGAIAGANKPTYEKSAEVSDAGTYYCVVSNAGGSITSSLSEVTVVADAFKPEIVRIAAGGNLDTIIVQFGERVNLVEAGDQFPYSIGGINPASVTIIDPGSPKSGTVVQLTLAAENRLASDTEYQMVLSGITDLAGNSTDDTRIYTFRTWVLNPAGGVLFQAFSGVAAPNTIDSLTSSPNFPNAPFTNAVLGVFDSRAIFPDDSHENYGSRVRGLFIPQVSGLWRFYIRSDDPGQVFVNPLGPDPAGKIMVINETGCCGDWNKYQSDAFQMEAGRGYYIESLQKEGGGGDYVKVAARLDGTGFPTLGTANTAIDGAALAGMQIGYPSAPAGIAGTITFTQQPATQSVLENATVTMSAAATSTYGLPMVFQWFKDGAPILDATGSSYTFLAERDLTGKKYSVEAYILGATAVSTEATLTVVPDQTPPTVASVKTDNTFSTIIIQFSELVRATEAEDEFNYTIEGVGATQVLSAILQADGKTVVLTLDTALPVSSAFTVTVNDVYDLANYSIVADQPVTFNSWSITAGFVTFQTYDTPVNGVDVSLLTNSPTFPNNPRETFYIRSFNTREAYPNNDHEQFGGRMYGVFIPPTTGNWIFYLSSDDAGELYVNPTGVSAIGKVLATAETGCCHGFSAHASSAYPLTEGVPIYIEALYKEGGGGDYCQVAAKLESDPTNPDVLQPIPASMLGTVIDAISGHPTVAITTQPSDQTVTHSQAPDSITTEEFTADNGGFSVVNGVDGGNPTGPTEQWLYNPARGVWAAVGGEGVKNTALNTPPYIVKTSGPLNVTFSHRYNFEDDSASGGIRWDGAIVRVSVNHGAYTYVPASALTGDGYKSDKTIGGNCPPVAGKFGFNGVSTGFASGAYVTTVATVGTFSAGDIVSVQFIAAWDEGFVATPAPDWEITSVVFSPALELNNADGVATFTVGATASLNAQPVTPAYQWQKDTGTGFADIAGATAAAYSFLPTAYDDGAKYRCVVLSPGAQATSDAATLHVVPKEYIARSGGTVVIAWPTPSTGYVLQRTAVLATPQTTEWITVDVAPVVVDGMNTVTLPGGAGNAFFRLVKSP